MTLIMIIIAYYSKTKPKTKQTKKKGGEERTNLPPFKGNFERLTPAHFQIFTFLNILWAWLHMQDIVNCFLPGVKSLGKL